MRASSLVAPAVALALAAPAAAVDLVETYELARRHEPQFQAAIAERDVNLATSQQAFAAYLPQASYSMTNIPTEDRTRQVVTVSQPLFSLDRLASFRQREPRRRYAEATFDIREQELAQRSLRAAIDCIRTAEGVTLNQARIDALREQAERAERLYDRGQGTITDARDVQVRYEQALANQIVLESEREAALSRFEALTGTRPGAGDFRLPERAPPIPLQPRDAYAATLAAASPQISAARQSEQVGRLEARRIRGALLPNVAGTASYSRTGSDDLNYVGIGIQAPLSAGGLFQARGADAAARRAAEERRQVETRVRVDFDRLYALVDAGQKALAISRKAVESAELSVEANRRSYEGGVRTNVDVVNSIQTLFEVKSQYVTSATTVAENLLSMLLLAADPPPQALGLTQRFLLGR
jgi:protease secretion system outer membrane protein